MLIFWTTDLAAESPLPQRESPTRHSCYGDGAGKKGRVTKEQLDDMLRPENMTDPREILR